MGDHQDLGVILQRDSGSRVLRVLLANPSRRNALDSTAVRRLGAAIRDAAENDVIAVVTITGLGDSFCAGADLHELRVIRSGGGSIGGVLDEWAALLEAIVETPKPIVCGVRGACVGGGFQIALLADYVIAAHDAVFQHAVALTEGIPSSELGTLLLPFIVGWKRAKALAVAPERLDSQRAYDLGICNAVVAPEETDAALASLAARMAAFDPAALAFNKAAINRVARDWVGRARESVTEAAQLIRGAGPTEIDSTSRSSSETE